jgi:hypothetical protein
LAIFVGNIQKQLGRRSREEPQPASPTMPQFMEMFESLRWTLAAMYLCIVGGICLLLVFHVHIHHPLPHELCWGGEESPMYLLLHLNSRCREV